MVEPLKMDEPELLREFGLSRRLATRVGALLSRKVGLSGLILELVGQMELLQELLLDKRLLQTDDLGATLDTLLGDEKFSVLADDPGLTVVAKADGWKILACEEELLADKGFSNAAHAAGEVNNAGSVMDKPERALIKASAKDVVADDDNSRSGSFAAEGVNDASPFTAREVARMRVDIFTAETSSQKVAALRQFVFAPVAESELREVFLQALADSDGPLRLAAARGLHQLGASSVFSESLILLAQGVELKLAVSRLGELLNNADKFEIAAAAMLLAGFLRDPSSTEDVLRPALQGLRALLGNVSAAAYIPGAAEMASLLRQRMLGAPEELQGDFRAVFAAFEKAYPGQIVPGLLQEALGSSSAEHRALLLDLLGGLELDADQKKTAAEMAAQTLLEIGVEHRHARFLRKLLLADPELGLALLAQSFAGCDLAHQRSLIRFFDNCLRSYDLSRLLKENMAGAALAALQTGPMQLRADIIETCVAARGDINHELRKKVALTLLESLRDYAQWPLCDYLESALVSLGDAAATVLMEALDSRKHNPDSAVLARSLGRIGMELQDHDSGSAELAGDILRRLSKLSFSDNKIQDSLHVAMGMLASRRGVSPAVNAMVMRTLLDRLTGKPSDAAILQALGRCCQGAIGEMSAAHTLCGICLSHLQADAADPGVSVSMLEGEEVFTLGQGVDFYSELIPASIEALQFAACSESIPDNLREKILESLLTLWNNFPGISVKWGLVNASRLTISLGEIGCSSGCSDRQRLQIAMVLRARAGSINVLESLAKIVNRPDRLPQMDKLAAAVLRRVLNMLQQGGSISQEDHEKYLRILMLCAARGRFSSEKDVDQLLGQVGQRLLHGARHGLAGALHGLQSLLDAGVFPDKVGEGIARQLKDFTALAGI